MPRILILGGTTEARCLAERLAGRADLDVTLSLAGRTASPARAAGAGSQSAALAAPPGLRIIWRASASMR